MTIFLSVLAKIEKMIDEQQYIDEGHWPLIPKQMYLFAGLKSAKTENHLQVS